MLKIIKNKTGLLADFYRIGIILICLIVTFMTPLIISVLEEKRVTKIFETMIADNEHALMYRLDSYKRILDGGAGLFKASNFVSLDEWKLYINELHLETEVNGLTGVGWIAPFKKDATNEFPEYINKTGIENFVIHPETSDNEGFIVVYIEPYEANKSAVGLDITFEKRRREAAETARKTGNTILTKAILLVQDSNKQPGFLLLRPVYSGMDVEETEHDRENAFSGWIYAPFIASNVFESLTSLQGVDFELAVYDGAEISDDAIIYKTGAFYSGREYNASSTFSIYGREWTLRWQSTAGFENTHFSYLSLVTFIGGLFVTSLIGLQLKTLANRASRVETEVLLKTEELKASRQQLSFIIANAPVPMALVDKVGAFFNVNEALAEFTGLKQEGLLGGDFRHFVEGTELPEMIRGITSVGKGTLKTYKNEHRFIHKTRGLVWGLIHISWIADDSSAESFFIVQIIDISEKKAAELVKGEFVASVSHELRTPLTSIKGALGLILGGMRDIIPGNMLRLIEIAHSNCDRLTNLVNDILDLEKMSSNKLVFNYSSEDLNDLIQNSANRIEPMANDSSVQFVIVTPEENPKVWIDVDRFEQVIANLLSNAVKFSKADGKVIIKVEMFDKNVKISVIDNGSGIPDNFRGKIFTAFAQADSSATRDNGGTGLGLNISKQLIERMGGSIGYESVPDVETVFWVTIPVSYKAEKKPDQTKQTKDTNIYKMRILHIEDDSDFAELVSETFSDVANITNASNISQAKDLLKTEPYSLIIIDWGLPDGDGKTLLADIKSHCKGTPIVGLSGAEPSFGNDDSIVELVKTRLTLKEIRDRCLIEIDKSS